MSAAKAQVPMMSGSAARKVSPYELALDEAANADSPFELEVPRDERAESASSRELMAAIEAFSSTDDGAAAGAAGAAEGEAAIAPNASEKLSFDSRRPWPLGLPPLQRALEALVSQVEIDASLEESHVRVVTLFPEWMFDEARSALGGGGNEVAWAAASAWRAVVAFDRADHPVGIDLPALLALTDETVQAREKLVGASAFALDGGAASEELLRTLDECIGRFVVLARHHERTRPATVSEATKVLSITSEPETAKRKVLPMAFVASLLFALLFHAARLLVAPSTDVWLVNGSIESGHAVLVPGGLDASPAALEAKISELRAQHIVATQGPDGQWYLSKEL